MTDEDMHERCSLADVLQVCADPARDYAVSLSAGFLSLFLVISSRLSPHFICFPLSSPHILLSVALLPSGSVALSLFLCFVALAFSLSRFLRVIAPCRYLSLSAVPYSLRNPIVLCLFVSHVPWSFSLSGRVCSI